MILRVVLAAFCLVALAVSGLSAYVRFTPLDIARWHADVVERDMSPGLRLSLFGSHNQANAPSFADAKKVAMQSVRDSM